MNNHFYNLVRVLAEKGQGVWAYKKYLDDSKDCAECQDLWQKLIERDQEEVDMLKKALIDHVKSGKID